MTRFAQNTQVPVERSRAEIERTLARYGAHQFVYGWDREQAVIGFSVDHEGEHHQIRFKLPLPDRRDPQFTEYKRGYSTYKRTEAEAERRYEQATRQSWRALSLVIKAKLEAVESGIATFDEEFLSYVMLPGGQTVGEHVVPQLDQIYETGQMAPSLLSGLKALPVGNG